MSSQMKKYSRIFPAGLVWGLALIVMVTAVVAPTFAQDEEETIIPLNISPLSVRTGVLSFPVSVIGNEGSQIPVPRLQEVEELTVILEDLTEGAPGIDIEEDFLPLSASALSSGIALYQESAAQPSSFRYFANDPSSDIPVDLLDVPTVEVDPTNSRRFFITFKPIPGSSSARIPLIQDSHPDFHIAVQTTVNLRQGDLFEFTIPANGIVINDRQNVLVKNTLYETPFPDDAFAGLNPAFAEHNYFIGDIVEIVSLLKATDNSYRVDAKSEAKTILGFDFVGRSDEDYFIKEINVNFVGLNLASISSLVNAIGTGFNFGGRSVAGVSRPTFLFNPYFYNFPEDPENPGMIWMEERNVGGEEPIAYPKTMPLNFSGFPRNVFFTPNDNINSHVLSYVPYGPRPFGSSGLEPTHTTNQDIFLKPLEKAAGGIFLYREVGGQAGKFDTGVDRIISMDPSKLKITPFDITADTLAENPALVTVLQRMFPGNVGGDSARRLIPWLFQDSDLSGQLVGVPASIVESISAESLEIVRPPLGSLECYMDPDCALFDQLINISRPFLGLTEGQVRYLTSLSGNEKSNLLDLYNFPLIQGFTVTLPVSRNNAVGDLRTPTSRTGANSGPDMYLAVKTSDKVRNLDSIIPFIQPTDIEVSNQLSAYTQGATDTDLYESVSSIGMGRPNTTLTSPLIGRPRPRFNLQDLTQPDEGINKSNNNVIFDRTLSSPPKAVIGIDAIDFGQNPTSLLNFAGVSPDLLDTFFTESAVLGEIQVDFLPGDALTALATLFNVIPIELGVTQTGPFLATFHSVALYVDDDTPSGDGFDNDGDGLSDEEYYNLQDDDGDGLIDEDLGDSDPMGENGVFDAADDILPYYIDNWGAGDAFSDSSYVFPPNNQTKFEEYITAIEPEDTPFDLEDGQVLPYRVGEGSWFAELDMRVLNFSLYSTIRTFIYPPRGSRPFDTTPGPDFGSPRYNQGMYPNLDPRAFLIDLYSFISPHDRYTDDLLLVDAETGDEIWMLTFDPDGDEDNIPFLQDPDGDVRRSFLLSLASALRVPDQYGFVKVGHVPMVVGVEADYAENANDPQGPDQPDGNIFNQFGHYTYLGDNNTIGDYLSDFNETFGEGIASALENIANYNAEVADAEAEPDEEGNVEYPDLPDPTEVQFNHPYNAIGISNFHETADYDTNYMYQVQIPDENFGPLAGNDFYITLRMSQLANVGDSFRVRMRSGELGAQYSSFNPDDNEFVSVASPEGGIAYHSYKNTDFIETEPFRGISKTQLTTSEIVVQSQNVSPRITFQTPSAGSNIATSDFTYQISYTVQDPDNTPQVALFVDDNGIGFDGTFISGSLVRPQVGLANSFTLDLLNQVPDFDPTQEYYIYARVDDGVNPLVYTYADGPVTTPARQVDSGVGSDGGGGFITVEGDLPNSVDLIKITSDGRSFSLGDLPTIPELTETDVVVDAETTPSFSGLIAVQRNGVVLASGDVRAFQSRLQDNGTLLFARENTAFLNNSVDGAQLITAPTASQITLESVRDIEVDFVNQTIYILDGDGDMLYLGANANTDLRPQAVGLDIYRDMELSPRGDNIYFLTGNGMLTMADDPNGVVWSDLQEEIDFYTDIELVLDGDNVGNVVIVNNDGGIHITGNGPGNQLASAVFQPQLPSEIIDPDTVRQIKVFPGLYDRYILVEGSGEIHYFGVDEIAADETPSDPYIFADSPGIDDDIVVDVETGNVNLQSIVSTVRDIITAMNDEDSSRIVSHAAPDYFDKNGATVNGLKKSLSTLFSFAEIITIAESRSNPNSFTLSNEGDTVRANVLLDMAYYLPEITYDVVDIEDGAVAPETVARMWFTDSRPAVGQTMRIREVFDGRAWLIDFYLIENFGRMFQEVSDSEDPEFEVFNELIRLPGNKLLGTYAPMNAHIDKPKYIKIPDIGQFQQYGLLFVYREQFLKRSRMQPVLEVAWYPGTRLSATAFNQVEFVFKRSSDGLYRMTSMSTRVLIGENDRDFAFADGIDETILSEIVDLEVEQPWGFSFEDRGPVIVTFPADGDLVLLDDNFSVTDPRGAIMMLPENTDIFALNPETFLNTITKATILTNPYDPNETDEPGQTASYVPGRSYFVIARDGKRYGFIQVPETLTTDPDTLDFGIALFDYRYQDDFILPSDF
jgi:hypothetical protein